MAAKTLPVRDGDVLLLVGTMKGAFLLRSDGSRRGWDASGPHFPGRSVYAMGYDGRGGRHRIWAAPGRSETRCSSFPGRARNRSA